jgi:hypothetical protein
MNRVLAGSWVAAVMMMASSASADVTGDVRWGLGATQTSTTLGAFNGSSWAHFGYDDVEFALMLPAFTLAGSLNENVALGARVSNFWYVPDDEEIVGGYLGLDARYLGQSGLFAAGGLGLMLTGETLEGDAEGGIGSDLRLGYLPVLNPHYGFGFFAELIAGIVDGDFTYSAGGGVMLSGR